MTSESARLILENLSPEKNLTSNGSKPIRVMTCTKSSGSDDNLPVGYLLPEKYRPPKQLGFFLKRKAKIEVLHEKLKTVLPMGILKKNPDPQLQQTFKPIIKFFCTFLTT